MAEFAESLLVIPKTLALNANLDAIELIGKLKTLHYYYQENQGSQDKESAWLKNAGLDLDKDGVRNCVTTGVLEPLISKTKSLKFATEAAIAILRIDDMIRIAPQQEQLPQRH